MKHVEVNTEKVELAEIRVCNYFYLSVASLLFILEIQDEDIREGGESSYLWWIFYSFPLANLRGSECLELDMLYSIYQRIINDTVLYVVVYIGQLIQDDIKYYVIYSSPIYI